MAASCAALVALSWQTSAHESEITKYSQKTLLKNWALSRCLSQAYPDGPSKEDASATASAYLEFGKQPIEVYEELSTIVDKFARRTYGGSVKSDFNTMKCIDLFHSQELDRLASKYSKTK